MRTAYKKFSCSDDFQSSDISVLIYIVKDPSRCEHLRFYIYCNMLRTQTWPSNHCSFACHVLSVSSMWLAADSRASRGLLFRSPVLLHSKSVPWSVTAALNIPAKSTAQSFIRESFQELEALRRELSSHSHTESTTTLVSRWLSQILISERLIITPVGLVKCYIALVGRFAWLFHTFLWVQMGYNSSIWQS